MKKNFILFALMLFLPLLAFAQTVTLNSFDPEAVTYNGTDQKPTPSVSTDPGSYQVRDAQLYYQYRRGNSGSWATVTANGWSTVKFIDAGTYQVRARWMGEIRYGQQGRWRDLDVTSSTRTFTIRPVQVYMSGLVASFDPASASYTGSEIDEPTVTVTYYQNYRPQASESPRAPAINNNVVTFGEDDFSISWTKDGVAASLQEPGDYTPVITFRANSNFNFVNDRGQTVNNRRLTANEAFTIAPQDISSMNVANVEYVNALTYNGAAQDPSSVSPFVVKDLQNNVMTLGTDYEVQRVSGGNFMNVGTYTFKIVGKGDKYTGEIGEFTYTIGRKYLKIAPGQVTKIYGEADPEPYFVEEGIDKLARPEDRAILASQYLVFNRATVSGVLDEGEDVGDHYYYITKAADMSGCDYEIDIENNTSILVIQPAKLYVHVAQNSKVYSGDPTTDPQDFTADKKVGTTTYFFTIANAAGDVITTNGTTPAKNATDYVDKTKSLKSVLKIGRKPGENVGQYDFTYDNKNYDVEFDGKFAIGPANVPDGVVVNVSAPTYDGTAKTPTPWGVSYQGVWLQEGVDWRVVGYSNNINAGDQAKLTLEFINNFSGTKQYTFTIKKRPLIVRAESYALKTGDAEPAFELKYEGGYGLAERDKDANGQPKISTVAPKFVIPNPAVIKKATGFTGIYTLEVVQEGWITDNYTLSFQDGSLTYDAAILNITADNKSKTYGSADPEFTVTVDWPAGVSESEKNRLLKPAGTLIYSLSREEGENVKADGYKISFKGPKAIEGYAINYVPGTLTINKKALTITPDNQSKTYGEVDPEFTATVTGLVQNAALGIDDTEESVLSTTYSFSTPMGSISWTVWAYDVYCIDQQNRHGENVGKYQINAIGQPEVANYTITYANPNGDQKKSGWLTINKRPLVITAKDLQKYYGQVDPALTVSYSKETHKSADDPTAKEEGLMSSQVFDHYEWQGWNRVEVYRTVYDEINGNAFKIERERSAETRNGENVGEYAIKFTRQDCVWRNGQYIDYNPNYDITYVNGKLTINPAELNVVALDQAIKYGKDINDSYVELADGTRQYAYEWSIVKDEEGNPKGGITTENGVKNDRVIVARGQYWNETLNDQIEQIIKLKAKYSNVGYHEKGLDYDVVEPIGNNYKINFTSAYLYVGALKTIPLNDKQLQKMYPDVAKKYPENTLAQVLDDHQGATVDVVMNGKREFIADTWYTLVLPFDIRVRDLSSALGYAVADIYNEANTKANDMYLKLHVGTLEANKPFVVKVDETIPAGNRKAGDNTTARYMNEITFADVVIAPLKYSTVDPSVTDAAGNQFIGTYKVIDDMDATQWFIPNGMNDFYHGGDPENKWPLVQTEAYWVGSNAAAPVRLFIEEPDGSITAIGEVEAEVEAEAAEGWYSVTGIKLDAEPTAPGTYIFNGKKVYIK